LVEERRGKVRRDKKWDEEEKEEGSKEVDGRRKNK
jgi:hypothetical protein